MNLTKFLRKHTRALLMVFMSLLLVAFLIPQQIQGCGNRRQAAAMKRGEAFGGRAVSQAALSRTRTELSFLRNHGLRPPVAPESALEYYLLSEEARQIGLRVGRDEVKELLRQGGRTDADLKRMQVTSRLGYDQIYDIIGRLVAVTRLLGVQVNGLYDSLPRQQLAYRDRVQEAVAQLSIIDCKAFVDQVGEPTEADLEAFFEECKARETAHTEQELVYGYRLPDRVRVEYLTIDPKTVEQKIKVRGVQVRQFFDDNAHRYTKPDPVATQPVQGQMPQVPMTFDEAQELVRADVREALAIETAQKLVNNMYDEAYKPWSAAAPGEDGFVPRPEGELVSFEELKERFSTKYEVEYGRTELVEQSVLRREPGFGQAAVGDAQQRTMAADLALRVKGIIDESPKDGRPVVNLMEPAPVAMTRGADPRTRQPRSLQAYLFRVVRNWPRTPRQTLSTTCVNK